MSEAEGQQTQGTLEHSDTSCMLHPYWLLHEASSGLEEQHQGPEEVVAFPLCLAVAACCTWDRNPLASTPPWMAVCASLPGLCPCCCSLFGFPSVQGGPALLLSLGPAHQALCDSGAPPRHTGPVEQETVGWTQDSSHQHGYAVLCPQLPTTEQ